MQFLFQFEIYKSNYRIYFPIWIFQMRGAEMIENRNCRAILQCRLWLQFYSDRFITYFPSFILSDNSP